jgi:SLBB domain
MRAYRLSAATSLASSRPTTRRCACALTLALLAAACVPSAVLPAAERFPSATAERPQTASPTVCIGILGAVRRPGVYRLPVGCTLAELVGCAGGLARDGDGNARVYRGDRLAQQLFVASSASTSLYSGDLIVIDCQSPDPSPFGPRIHSRQAASDGSLGSGPTSGEVEIALLNLIDRPVVIKLAREQASLAGIVEFLRQPAELVEQIRAFSPSRTQTRGYLGPESNAESLRSGTVLIFPKRRVQLASLPALPDPIVSPHSRSVDEGARRLASIESSDSRTQTQAPPKSAGATSTASSLQMARELAKRAQRELLIRAATASKSSSQMDRATDPGFRNVAPNGWDGQRARGAEGAYGQSRFFFFVIAGTAVLAMLMTISSMGSRWIDDHRARLQDRSIGFIPPVLSLSKLATAIRPVRIDANQPQTRLGIDLAVFERAKANPANTASGLSESTPKAA